MNKHLFNIICGVAIVLGALNSPFASACDCMGGGAGMNKAMFKKMNLTEEQTKKIADLRSGQKEKNKAARDKMKQAHEKLEKLMNENASKDDISDAHEELNKAHSALSELRFNGMLAVREVLTPEQRAQFKEAKGSCMHAGKKGKHGKMKKAKGDAMSCPMGDDEDADE